MRHKIKVNKFHDLEITIEPKLDIFDLTKYNLTIITDNQVPFTTSNSNLVVKYDNKTYNYEDLELMGQYMHLSGLNTYYKTHYSFNTLSISMS